MGSRLVGKVALISGAARGMGSTEAGILVEEGAKVVLGDLLDEEGQFIADGLNKGATSKRAIYLHLDVTSAHDWANAVAIAEREFGSLDVLVNNAGVLSMLGLEEETEEGCQRVVDINQKGVWLGMRAAVPAMRRAGGGSIVNISSMYGLIGSGAATAY
jgi:NAD(P)-dependent dehydrogenase (short-subunit alcohol dehydrogenase family)